VDEVVVLLQQPQHKDDQNGRFNCLLDLEKSCGSVVTGPYPPTVYDCKPEDDGVVVVGSSRYGISPPNRCRMRVVVVVVIVVIAACCRRRAMYAPVPNLDSTWTST
jgi:hypothetical protein